ncbi:hypothetical protein BOTCAL_0692g00020 [Botryotinia calthae]|uniref:Uncharacterized protein n=1 Tax=Botryotinia calthae TaxID=38488 RepID=A0A4Y8CIZ4_9HELO|nr:hypothetical protein BOTCAL_0692g00020 [Botryotinia calthae]
MRVDSKSIHSEIKGGSQSEATDDPCSLCAIVSSSGITTTVDMNADGEIAGEHGEGGEAGTHNGMP